MSGKVALVTGSSRGIGAATAAALSRAGWDVCINYIQRQDKAEALAEALRGEGGRAITCQADVSDREAVFRMVRRVEEELGPVNLLVNNAGIARQQQFQDILPETWNRLFAVNLGGCFHCTQAVLPHMLHEHSGCIINVLTRSLSAELSLSGIRVNCVAPGVIDTDMVQVLGRETLEELAREIPLGRLGRPEEIAETVLYLAENPYITGQVITVDGGFLV